MTELSALQQWMLETVTHPAGINPDGVAGRIRPSATLNPLQRLAIYNRSYHARLLDCFRSLFPVLLHALDGELFEHFAMAYLHAHPPTSYTLARLADGFSGWLAETRPEGDESWPDFIIELAAFELAFREVYDGVAPERVFRFRHPVHGYHAAVRRGEKPEVPEPRETFVLLCLRGFRVVVHELSEVEYRQLTV